MCAVEMCVQSRQHYYPYVLQCRRTLVGNALAVPVACAAVTAGVALVGTAGACLNGYAACKAVSFGVGQIRGFAGW